MNSRIILIAALGLMLGISGCSFYSCAGKPYIEVTLGLSYSGINDQTWVISDPKEIAQVKKLLPKAKLFIKSAIETKTRKIHLSQYGKLFLAPKNIPSLPDEIMIFENIIKIGDNFYISDDSGSLSLSVSLLNIGYSRDIHGLEAWLTNKTMEKNLPGIEQAVKYFKAHNLLGDSPKYTEPPDNSWMAPYIPVERPVVPEPPEEPRRPDNNSDRWTKEGDEMAPEATSRPLDEAEDF